MQRYHGLDFLRAAMMLMGIILHVGVCYMPFPYGDDAAAILADFKNPYRDIESYSMSSQRLVLFINFFRMPAFQPPCSGSFYGLWIVTHGRLVKASC